MFNLTVEDASKRLGVGRARVNQLIRSGMLAAEKVGGIWLIDEQSVEARRNAAPKAGRPPARFQQRGCGALRADESHARGAFRFRYDEGGRCGFVDAQGGGNQFRFGTSPCGRGPGMGPSPWAMIPPPEVEKSRKTRCRSGGSIAASPELEKASTRSWPSWASIHLRGFPSRALGCLCRISIGFVPKTVKSPGRT